jgi:hypothetical protein
VKQPPARHEFSAEEIAEFLDELDSRLKKRNESASIFIVGGAAIAMITGESPRRTEDIDAITHDSVVIEESRRMAEEHGLPPNWLNDKAAMWMPPLPPGALRRHPQPGLHVTYATDEFLFATKLIAQRRRDAPDMRLLARRLGLRKPTPAELEAIIRRYYIDPGALEMIIGGDDIDSEIRILSVRAAGMLARTASQVASARGLRGSGARS